MCCTVHKTYRGWDVTIRCSPRSAYHPDADPATYTAIAEAELEPGQDPADWVDPRIQLISTGNHFFQTGNLCVEGLFSEIKQLIDALKR